MEVQLDKHHDDVGGDGDDVMRVGEHVSELHASEAVNHNSFLPASNEQDQYLSTSQVRNPDIVEENGNDSEKSKDSKFAQENRRTSIAEQLSENLDESNREDNNFAPGEVQSTTEPPQRILSEDSSYQYDFYGRSGPARLEDSHSSSSHQDISFHGSQEEESPNPEEGSKLTYRLSKKGYRIKSSNDPDAVNPNPYYSEEKLSHSVTDYQHDLLFDQDFATDLHNTLDDEDDSDNEGYHSGLDEFEQELANLANRNANMSLDASTKNETSEDNPMSAEKSENSLNNNSFLNKNDLAFGPETNHADVGSVSLTGRKIPSRDSISGSSTRSDKLQNCQSAVIAVAASASFEEKNTDDMTSLSEIAPQKVSEGESPVAAGQSRGAPDGMPTQRKINAGTDENSGKPQMEVIVASAAVSQELTLSELMSDLKTEDPKIIENEERVKSKTNDHKVSEVSEKPTPSNPLSSPENIRPSVSGLQCNSSIQSCSNIQHLFMIFCLCAVISNCCIYHIHI